MIYGRYGDIVCEVCNQAKLWYNFPVDKKGELKGKICLKCVEKNKTRQVTSKLYLLLMAADKNKMVDLRNHLFDCLNRIKTKEMTTEEAKAACQVAQTIINSARLEMDFMKMIKSNKSEFFELENGAAIEQ